LSQLLLPQDGATPLFKASHKGHVEVVQELLKYQPNLSLLPVSNVFTPHILATETMLLVVKIYSFTTKSIVYVARFPRI